MFTPYGKVGAKPKFTYDTALKTGFPDNLNVDSVSRCNEFASSLYPLVGRNDGAAALDFLCALLPLPFPQPGLGEISQLALGGRDADPDSPPLPGSPRPDLDLTIARTQDEKKPAGSVEASARVEYDVAGLIPEKFRKSPFKLSAEVFVTPSILSRFASQFQVYGSDAFFQDVAIVLDCGNPADFGRTQVVLDSRAESFVRFNVVAGFDLVLKLTGVNVGFATITLTVLEKHPKFEVLPEPIEDEAEDFWQTAMAVFEDSPVPSFASLTSFSAGPVADPAAFITECFAAPPPPGETPPTPSFTPDDPIKLGAVLEFPCNICIAGGSLTQGCGPKEGFPTDYECRFDDGVCTDPAGQNGCDYYPIPPGLIPVGTAGNTGVLFPAEQDLIGKQWLCDAPQKTGCMDLCTYDPTASQPLTVVQSAVDLDPDRCGTSGGGMICTSLTGCDDGNPCTKDECVFKGEFGTCTYTAQDGACDDGLFCNGADRCALGACALHDGNPCVTAQGCCEEGTDTCLDSCPVPVPRCGNGLLQPGEECDDGNDSENDGCSSSCAIERTELDCGPAFASPSELWPPNHKFVDVSIAGVTDPAGAPVDITITGITQDEPLNGPGDGNTCPDASGVGSAVAHLRAERTGAPGVPGDGRVYHVSFTAFGQAGQCSGTVTVCVPHDQGAGHACVDQGALVDATEACP